MHTDPAAVGPEAFQLNSMSVALTAVQKYIAYVDTTGYIATTKNQSNLSVNSTGSPTFGPYFDGSLMLADSNVSSRWGAYGVPSYDMAFTATFVPEPISLGLISVAVIICLRRQRV